MFPYYVVDALLIMNSDDVVILIYVNLPALYHSLMFTIFITIRIKWLSLETGGTWQIS
jgi:hypothetical protein